MSVSLNAQASPFQGFAKYAWSLLRESYFKNGIKSFWLDNSEVSAATVGLGCDCLADSDGRPLLRTAVDAQTRLRIWPAGRNRLIKLELGGQRRSV